MAQLRPVLKYKTTEESLNVQHAKEKTVAEEKAKDRQVRFHSADIFIHLHTIGDNPSVKKGPPMQIQWTCHCCFSKVDLNTLESEKQPSKTYRRKVGSFPARKRMEILMENGVPRRDIQRAQKEATIGRNRRYKTIENLSRQKTEERLEEIRFILTCKREPECPVLLERVTSKALCQLQ